MKTIIKWDTLPKPYHRRYKETIGAHALLVLNEHHGTLYYHMNSERVFADHILHIVERWVGYYIYEPEKFTLKEPQLTLEKAKELPKQYQDLAIRDWKHFDEAKQEHQKTVDLWNLVQSAIKTKNYTDALIVFDQVTGYGCGRDPGFEFLEMQ
jgi:hypothetical protein